jgi:hypothetical protein
MQHAVAIDGPVSRAAKSSKPSKIMFYKPTSNKRKIDIKVAGFASE